MFDMFWLDKTADWSNRRHGVAGHADEQIYFKTTKSKLINLSEVKDTLLNSFISNVCK